MRRRGQRYSLGQPKEALLGSVSEYKKNREGKEKERARQRVKEAEKGE